MFRFVMRPIVKLSSEQIAAAQVALGDLGMT